MSHSIEPAPSARAKCRGCGRAIAKGELRLGERLPNPYADEREMTLWFHLRCGAYKRPEVLLTALEATPDAPGAGQLRAIAEIGVAHPRVSRIDGVERATSGRARCRHCREAIAKESLRIPLVYYAEGRFEPSGFIHVGCALAYFGTTEILDRATHFGQALDETTRTELVEALSQSAT